MRLINPTSEIIKQEPGLSGIHKQIETVSSVCEVLKPTSKTLVEDLIASFNSGILEHGTVYLYIPFTKDIRNWGNLCVKYTRNPYSSVHYDRLSDTVPPTGCYVTTNYRVLLENNWLDDLKYLCEPTEHHERRITARFTTSIGVSKELVKYRRFSRSQQSTRISSKAVKELSFTIPSWMNRIEYYKECYGIPGDNGIVRPQEGTEHYDYYLFLYSLLEAESTYLSLIKEGRTPRQAGQVLPNAFTTELVMTGFVKDWLELSSHCPDIMELLNPIINYIKTSGYDK
jgi:thymidylate synthase (FAD)